MSVHIIKPSGENRAVSFSKKDMPGDRSSWQTHLIVSLIAEAIKRDKPITIDDIIGIYLDSKFKTERDIALGWKWNEIDRRWERKYMKKEEWAKSSGDYKLSTAAKQWFKINLGAAILKGKILAIPVIEI